MFYILTHLVNLDLKEYLKFKNKLKHNLTFFYLNYIVLTVVLFCLTLLISPSAIIGIALLGAAWMYVIRHTQQSGNLIIYGTSYNITTALLFLVLLQLDGVGSLELLYASSVAHFVVAHAFAPYVLHFEIFRYRYFSN